MYGTPGLILNDYTIHSGNDLWWTLFLAIVFCTIATLLENN